MNLSTFDQYGTVYALESTTETLTDFATAVTRQGFPGDRDITILAPPSLREPHHGDEAWWVKTINAVTVRVAWQDRLPGDPLIGDVQPEIQAYRLDAWRRIIGTPYYGSPGVAATMNLRARDGMRGVQWKIRESGVLSTWQPPAKIHDLSWKREAKKTKKLANACRWDLRAAYLAAMSQAMLPAGKLEPTGSAPILPTDGGTGYYRVRVAKADPWRAWLGQADRHGCHWLGASTYQVMGCPPVLDSYTAPGRRILRGWAESWRDHLAACQTEPFRSVLKDGYTQMVGLFAVPSGTVYRPDWRHLIIDYTRAMMLQRIRHVSFAYKGLLPSCVDVDSVWYHHPVEIHHHTLSTSLRAGNLIGQFRSEDAPCLTV